MIKKTILTITTVGMLLAALATFVTPLNAELQKPGEEFTVRVMTYNACRGGTYFGQPLSQSAKMIELAKADIVGLQEIGANVPELAKLLGWNHGGPFLTRYEIVEHSRVWVKDRGMESRSNYLQGSMPMPSTLIFPADPIRLTN